MIQSDSFQVLLDQKLIIDTVYVALSDTVYTKILISNSQVGNSVGNEILKNGLTILIALIAGLVALVQVKSNVVSSARIRWIEDLKSAISELYDSSMNSVLYWEMYTNASIKSDQDKWYSNYDEAHSKFNILSNKIKMHLNPYETDHRDIEKYIDNLDQLLDSENTSKLSQTEIEQELKNIVTVSRKIFKKEWNKSKRLFKI